jgi:hypothetical protein
VAEFTILPKQNDPNGGRAEPIVRMVQQIAAYQPKRPVRVEWKIAVPERTAAENRYLWAVPYKMISEVTGYDIEDLHEWNCGAQWGWTTRPVPKSPKFPTGLEQVPARTTTTNFDGEVELCSEEEFIELWVRMQRLGATKFQINIPDPDKDYKAKRNVA